MTFPYLQEPAPICRICTENVVMLREFVICAAMARRIFSRAAAFSRLEGSERGAVGCCAARTAFQASTCGQREARHARPGPDYGVSLIELSPLPLEVVFHRPSVWVSPRKLVQREQLICLFSPQVSTHRLISWRLKQWKGISHRR
jgi:hypothetical protein